MNSKQPTLYLPLASRYWNLSPTYEIGGWRRLSHRFLTKAEVRSLPILAPLGSEAASWIMRSSYVIEDGQQQTALWNKTLPSREPTSCLSSSIKPLSISVSPMDKRRLKSWGIRMPWLIRSATAPLRRLLRVLGLSRSLRALSLAKF